MEVRGEWKGGAVAGVYGVGGVGERIGRTLSGFCGRGDDNVRLSKFLASPPPAWLP